MFRRLVLTLAAVLLVTLVVNRPPTAFVKGAVTGAVLLTLYGLKLAWARATARFGINRCHLHTGGLVVTGLLGGVRDAVAWSEVTVVNETATVSLWMTFRRFEITRDQAPPLAFLALGQNPTLSAALESQAAKNGIRR
ncbi:hypothetical protein [Streptomyces sp. NPDC050263]|uniref:hypothetical protein n=1 Tax=Streptomyces sp. NPDC050263 TaxID=3155037 RepID=UPI003419D829